MSSKEASAQEWKEKGNTAFRLQQYAEAVQHYSKGLEVDPDNCVIHANRSACYLALEENEKAIEDADAAIAANPLYWKSYTRKAQALANLAAAERDQGARLSLTEKAVAVVRDAQGRVPELDRDKLLKYQHDLQGQIDIEKAEFKNCTADEFSIDYLARWQVNISESPGTRPDEKFKYFMFCDDPKSETPTFPLMMISTIFVDPEANIEQSIEEQLMSFVMSRGLSASSAKLDSFAVNTKKGVTLQCRTTSIQYTAPTESVLTALTTGTRGLVLMVMYHYAVDENAGMHRLAFTRILESLEFKYKVKATRRRQWILLRNIAHIDHRYHFKLDVPKTWSERPRVAKCANTDHKQLLHHGIEWSQGSGTMSLEVSSIAHDETLESRRDLWLSKMKVTSARICDDTLGDLVSMSVSYFTDADRTKWSKVILGRTMLGMQHYVYTLHYTFQFGVPMPENGSGEDDDVERNGLLWVLGPVAASFQILPADVSADSPRITYLDMDHCFQFTCPARLQKRVGSGPAVVFDMVTPETLTGGGLCSITMLELPSVEATLEEAQKVMQSTIPQLTPSGDEHFLMGCEPVMMRTAKGMIPSIGHVQVRFCAFLRNQRAMALFILSSQRDFEANWRLGRELFQTLSFTRQGAREYPCASLSPHATEISENSGGVLSGLSSAIGSMWT